MERNVDKLLQDLLSAKNRLKQESDFLIFSYVEKVSSLSAMHFFQNCRSKYKGSRFFWQSADRKLKFAGADGYCIHAQGGCNRFQEVETGWQNLTQHSEIHGLLNMPGTGPICFGGFSFYDQLKEGSSWSSFSTHLFYLPKFLVTENEEGSFITATMRLEQLTTEQELRAFVQELVQLLMSHGELHANLPPLDQLKELASDEWLTSVTEAVQYMQNTPEELQKIVLARSLQLTFHEAVFVEAALLNLIKLQPNSTVFCLERGEDAFIGATPECLIKKYGDQVDTDCLAGTIDRGKTTEEDAQLASILLNDDKNQKEHQFVVDHIRAIISESCVEVNIPAEPKILVNRHLQHLHTPVSANLSKDISIFELVSALHPTPALGGTPVQKAMEMIPVFENIERGLFAAPIGWVDANGDGEFVVGIRSALISEQQATLFAGCGVVAQSIPSEELLETIIKFKPMLTAFAIEEMREKDCQLS